MSVYAFKRVTTEFFHVSADDPDEALARVHEEPGRYQEGFHEEVWEPVPLLAHHEEPIDRYTGLRTAVRQLLDQVGSRSAAVDTVPHAAVVCLLHALEAAPTFTDPHAPCCRFHATGGERTLSCGGDVAPTTAAEHAIGLTEERLAEMDDARVLDEQGNLEPLPPDQETP